MSMPGFGAEASLYKREQVYRGLLGTAGASHGVVPQYLSRCFQNCLANSDYDDPYAYQNCNCICYGHPGRTCHLQ